MSKTKKKRRNTKRKNQPVTRRQVTKTQSKPAKNTNSPIPQSLLNTVSDSTVQDSIEILNLLNELNYGNDGGLQENSDRIYRLYNVPGPHLWKSRFINAVLKNMGEKAGVSDKRQQEIIDRFNAIKTQNPKAGSTIETIRNAIFIDEDAAYNDLPSEQVKKIMKFIPLDSVDDVTFYHGTSYENYLQIKEDGFIRRTHYEDYTNKKSKTREKYFKGHTGYVFLSDSIDKPLSFSFGGFRTALLDYNDEIVMANDYFSRQTGTKLNKNNIGVIFEFQPRGYNVSYAVSESDFVVDCDIPFTDIGNVRFLYADNNFQIKEITEQEIEERGIE
ncbi:MAG: hypothetical protein LUD84_06480 [Clostridiales bacterium]|nr:hypothetical protein [Clostridiales bacterium]